MPSQKRADRSFLAIIGILVLAGAAVIGYILSNGKGGSSSVVVDTTLPMVNAKGKTIGSDSAPIEIVMYGDFECPGCGQYADVTEAQVRSEFVVSGIARYRFADFLIHPTAMLAHAAASCAADQDKFWPMHDRIYHLRYEWSSALNGRDMKTADVLKRFARDLQLDEKAFNACLDSREKEKDVLASTEAGDKIGVNGTPTVIVGKRMIIKDRGIPTYDDIRVYVDSALADVGLKRR